MEKPQKNKKNPEKNFGLNCGKEEHMSNMPPYIRKFRKEIAKEFGVNEQTVDTWANEGLKLFGQMRVSDNPRERELYRTIAKAFVPAYFVGVQQYVLEML